MRIATKIIAAIAVVVVIWFVRALAADRERSAPIVEVLNVGTRPIFEVDLKRHEKAFTQPVMPPGMSMSWVIQESDDPESIEISWLPQGSENRTIKTIEVKPRERNSFDIVRWHRITVKDDDVRVDEMGTIPILR